MSASKIIKTLKNKRPKRITKRFIILAIAVVGLFGLVLISVLGSNTGAPVPGSAEDLVEEIASEAIPDTEADSQTAKDEEVAFTIRSIRCNRTKILDEEAAGRFCIVGVNLRNESGAPISLQPKFQYADVSGERRFKASSNDGYYADNALSSPYREIAPGETIGGSFVFDIPFDTRLKTLELHSTEDSEGVVVIVEE
jgi:hypothetical protein